jgi:NADH-quinone oxidoreductase subunit N
MDMSQFYTTGDYFSIIPAVMLVMFACAILLFDFVVFPDPRQRKFLLIFVVMGEFFTGLGLYRQHAWLGSYGVSELSGFGGSITVDGFAIFFNWIFLIAAVIVALASYKYLEVAGEHHGEYYALMLFAQCGMYFLATGTDLITLFIGLELMALCFYVMVGFLRTDRRSNEAALKYLILGAFSSGFLVYGFSVMYGMAGSTKLANIASAIQQRPAWDPVVFLALTTTSVGLLFKISAVPFHMWAPDAYEGAPTTVTAYLSVGSTAASIAFLLRIFLGPLASARDVWEPLLSIIAVLTLTVGNLAAINQTNIKRLLAYSSISHAGYMLLGLIAGNDTGINGIAVYIMVYTFMNRRAAGGSGHAPRQHHRGRPGRCGGPGPQESLVRVPDAAFPALAGRHSADRGLPGQVLHFPGADSDRALRPGGVCHAVRGGGHLLLLQDCAQHVQSRG